MFFQLRENVGSQIEIMFTYLGGGVTEEAEDE